MFNKFFTIMFFPLIFMLLSCAGSKKSNLSSIVKGHCIKDDFSQGLADNVYGRECIEGKQLVIKTSNKGDLFSTSKVSDSKTGLKIADDIGFKNKFHIPNYTILKGEGDDREIPFLLDLLPKDEKFRGSLNTKYRIIFQTMGDYLVLFKATKDLKDLPYVERTSLKIFRNGKRMDYEAKSYDRKKGDYYMTPFIGYAINYCTAETILDQNKRRTKESRLNCEDSHIQSGSYIKLNMDSKKAYNYKLDLKTDFFPSEYFDGLWFFAQGPVEMATAEGQLDFKQVYLVSLEREEDSIQIQDISGNVEARNRKILKTSLPVKWLDFEMAQDGNGYWKEFGERKIKHSDNIKRLYAQIDLDYFDDIVNGDSNIEELILENDYLSYTHNIIYDNKLIKYKTSFFKAQAPHKDCSANNNKENYVNCLKKKMNAREQFTPRRWFLEDNKSIFGILSIIPQDERQEGEVTTPDKTDHIRMIKFNTALNTEEEKETRRKIIKWYFSKNSTKDTAYREAAKEAVDIYNQAFAYLSKGRDKQIEVKLVQGEEKDLGDIRYNIINLIKTKDIVGGGSGLLGAAPSYANPDTGQIIGATANIVIHNNEKIFYDYVRDYIRYEVFQRKKRTKEENEIHVVTPYIREQIQEKCPEVTKFVKDKTSAQPEYSNEWSGKNHRERQEILIAKGQGRLKQNEELGDKDIIISCGKTLTANSLLSVILHEMGHNFGLAHNFKASTDSENYWKKTELEVSSGSKNYWQGVKLTDVFPKIELDSEQELAKYSSVMDYAKIDQITMSYLGKYDLAALRYLYFDEIEKKEGTTEDIADPLKNQQALIDNEEILKDRQSYQYCRHKDANSVMMCDTGDYGGNPQEIVQELILSFKRNFNLSRYRYDWDEKIFNLNSDSSISNVSKNQLDKITKYYQKWLSLMWSYFNNKGVTFDYALTTDSIDKYKAYIEWGREDNKEYALYYPVRKEVSDFIMTYLLDLSEMKCHIKDKSESEYIFSLEIIKSQLSYDQSENLYVEDCRSFQILDFFEKNQLTFVKQTGYENFSSYSPLAENIIKDLKSFRSLIYELKQNISNLISMMMEELDKLNNFDLKMQDIMLNLANYQDVKIKAVIDQYKQKLFKNLQYIQRQMQKGASGDALLLEQLANWQSQVYTSEIGEDSFYNKVLKPIETAGDDSKQLKKVFAEQIQIPFVETAYNAYLNTQTKGHDNNILNFWKYISDRKDTVIGGNNEEKFLFTIPYKEDSFSVQWFTKRNESLRQKIELDTKLMESLESLSIVEKLQMIFLHNYLQNDLK